MDEPADPGRVHLRVARPTDDLDALVAFYRDGLGFEVLSEFRDHDGFDGVMLGRPGAAYHLEFTRRAGHPASGAPSAEHLLVFYLPDEAAWRVAVARLEAAGHRPVASENPYWDRRGRTFADPDGYRVVLQNAPWPADYTTGRGGDTLDEWTDWESGDCICAPDDRTGVEQAEVLRGVAAGFRRVEIDWVDGDRWVRARVAKAVALGFLGFLLDAEHALRGRAVLVSVADDGGPEAVRVRFYMTPDTGCLDLNYQPASAEPSGRALAAKLAAILGYEFVPRRTGEPAP